jgi:Rieske Fe-S protein
VNQRRRFLKVLGAAAVTAGAMPGCGDGEGGDSATTGGDATGGAGGEGGSGSNLPPHNFPAGWIVMENAATVPVGKLVKVLTHSMWLGRDAAGFYVMTSQCPHELCDMINDLGSNGITCHCHGSLFDRTGALLGGPATIDLRHYYHEFDEFSRVGIDASTKVDITFRGQPV